MKTAKLLAAILAVGSSTPFLAQRPDSAAQAPPTQQQVPPEKTTPQAWPAPSAPAASATDMKPVSGQLVSDLDSKTAKTGDSIVIETSQTVKTADGTEIPQGSKIVGHVLGVKASGQGNENSQVALAFDHAELKGGQTVPVKTELRSLSPSEGEAQSSQPQATGAAPGSNSGRGNTPSSPGPGSAADPNANQTPNQQGSPGGGSSPAGSLPPAGVVVARTGNIDIRTTAIPGVLLANNQPGMQDPRMAQSSGILLGARKDIHLNGGTQVVIAVAGAGTNGGGN